MERSRSSGLAPVVSDTGADESEDFDSLVRLHRPRVFRFILASLRDRETAENLTQDCFVRAYQARGQFRGASSIATWFMKIAANLVRNHESSSRLKFWRRSLHSGVDMADIGNSIADRQQSAEEAALVQEQVKAIWAAAASLSARQRTVFLLRFVEDMDILEIAAATGMKEGTVKVHMFRALQAVRARIDRLK